MQTVIQFFIQNIYNPFMSFADLMTKNAWAFCGAIAVFCLLAFITGKLQSKTPWAQLPGFLSVFVCLLIITSIWLYVDPIISKYMKSIESTSSKSKTTTTPSSNSSSDTSNQNSSGTNYTQPKQLYYYVSCSGCYAEGCARNGYSYGGYSESLYYYYKSLCQACSCTSYKAQSFWR